MKEEDLVFIVSQPRAGSTYLQNLLSNNNDVNTCSEPWILLNFASQIKPDLVDAKFENNLSVQAFNLYKEKYKDYNFKEKQKEYLLSLYAPMLKGFNLVIDKTPRYWEIIDEIVVLFPKSKIIVLKRNPIDVVKSMVKTWDLNTLEKLSVFKRDVLLAPKRLQNFCVAQHDNPNVLEVSYEALIDDTNTETEKVYKWLGVSYTNAVLDVSENTKYKGAFGDPYQNTTKKHTPELQKKPLKNKYLLSFLSGYVHFLGVDFFKSYGNYNQANHLVKKTRSFNKFVSLDASNAREELTQNKKQYIKKLFSNRKFNL